MVTSVKECITRGEKHLNLCAWLAATASTIVKLPLSIMYILFFFGNNHVYTFNKSLGYLCLIFSIIKMLVKFLLYMFVLSV